MIESIDEKCLKIEYLPCLNYAMTINGRKCLEYLELTNDTHEEWRALRLTVTGEMVAASEAVIDSVPAGQTVRVGELKVMPDVDKLRERTESVDTKFTLKIETGGLTVLEKDYDVRLLAFDEWPGATIMPELLAAFVTPNAPELSRVKVAAAEFLERLTGSSALDEYQTQDPNRVRAQVAAIYEALRSESLVYSAPPASYEKTGQRVRLVDKVLGEKLGTCLDLSLLFCSALEACGLHPLLMLQQGHAYVGCWLVDKYHFQTTGDDISLVSKSISDGISEMVLVESTDIAASGGVAFEEAVRHAENHIVADEDKFVLFCDIYRCRLEGLRPLPVRINGEWQTGGIDHQNATEGVKTMNIADINTRNNDESKLTRQQIWERKLLDFSLRNNLVNIRVGKKMVPFISYQIENLEDNLHDGSDYQILPSPAKKKIEPNEFGVYDSRLYQEELETVVIEDLKHDKICSYLTEDELRDTLKGLFRASRTALEENGANSLFLVLGLLKWFETEKSVRPRFAPLLLMPVDIIRRSGNNYVIRTRDEEITFNTTLMEMLKQQHDINLTGLSPLPEDEHGIDVKKVFAIVRSHLVDHPKWDIVEESMLGLFSFNKFVMWNDIHNNAEKMRRSPIIESLLKKHWVGDGNDNKAADAREIDLNVAPGEFAIPVDVDSSQMEAVVESGEGRSFILYGPPGTGKSQTITNMISNALFHGRRVLFVAEKMAALQVVQNRLAKIGLAPFCLEMHSNKVTKSHLLKQLASTLDLTRIKEPEQYQTASQELFQQRQKLIGYMNLLHRKQPNGLSLYDCITQYESFSEEAIRPTNEFVDNISLEKLRKTAEDIALIDTVFTITGQPAQHPLNGLSILDPSMTAQDVIGQKISQLLPLVPQVMAAVGEIATNLRINIPVDVKSAAWTQQLIDCVCQMPIVNNDVLKIADNASLLDEWKSIVSTGQQRDAQKAALLQNYSDDILGYNVAQLQNAWQQAQQKWFLPRFFAKRSIVSGLKAMNSNASSNDVEPLIGLLNNYQQLDKNVNLHSELLQKVFGPLGRKGQEKWDDIKRSLKLAPAIVRLLKQYVSNIDAVNFDASIFTPNASLTEFNSIQADSSSFTLDSSLPLASLREKIPVWLDNLSKCRDWAQWCQRKKELCDAHLQPTVDYILADNGHSAAEAANATLKGVYRVLAARIIDSNPQLQMFNGLIFEDAISKYRELAKQFQDLTKKMLYSKLAANVPSQALEPSASSELGILKRYIASSGRGATIRHIIDQIPTLLPKLCPVMLMSPISVAQFIDLDQPPFDIVCFDEASQMPTSEAVGAIARGKALICVGDPKQMPPTSFFATNAVDDDEADIDDMESILDDCITLSLPARYLTWHYRSRHESLIAFSNAQYYDGKLYTFPSVDDRVSKVQLVHVDGTYDFGKSRSNRAEAEAIVKETIRRLSDPELSKRSIGIVSFSKVQQNLIEDLLTDELAKHPELEKRAYDGEEPIFTKNLENVQGDERDVILFSVGYGPDKRGKVSMNFGPLNNVGGERRLNVAVSRARYEMIVFSTLQPEQIDLRRSNAKGVEGLKHFLEFARNGRIAIPSSQQNTSSLLPPTSSLINAIADEIRKHGYQVDTAVGRSQFKIDIAVVNPDDTSNYILGIRCDGQNYYETKTQRDREICQPGVLQGLSWNLMRVWAVDWFSNKDAVIKRILQQLQSKKSEESRMKNQRSLAEGKSNEESTNAPATKSPAASTNSTLKNDSSLFTPHSSLKKDSPLPFAVDEDEIVNIVNERVLPYTTTSLSGTHDGTIEHLLRSQKTVTRDLQKIISTEQPITLSLITKRIAQHYQLPRVTPKLQNFILSLLTNFYQDSASPASNPTFWLQPADAQGYNHYREASQRDIDDVPLIEIQNAAQYAVEQQISIPLDDLKRQTAHMLGFKKTAKVDNNIEQAIALLIDKGILTENNGDITTINN